MVLVCCLGEPQELPAGPEHMITVGNTGVTHLKSHQYPANHYKEGRELGGTSSV